MVDSRRDTVLDMWANKLTADQIADELFISRDAVFMHLRCGRGEQDPRAARRYDRAPATRRKAKIAILNQIGVEKRQIAKMIGISTRMVEIRLKEASAK